MGMTGVDELAKLHSTFDLELAGEPAPTPEPPAPSERAA